MNKDREFKSEPSYDPYKKKRCPLNEEQLHVFLSRLIGKDVDMACERAWCIELQTREIAGSEKDGGPSGEQQDRVTFYYDRSRKVTKYVVG